MILDIGSGPHPMGDINLDLNSDSKPDIVADGQNLPFIDNVFETVRASHTIEHLKNPIQFIKELYRVSNSRVLIICPHRYARSAKVKGHIQFFNVTWFKRALENLGISSYRIQTTFYLLRPLEIQVEIKKRCLAVKSWESSETNYMCRMDS